MRHRLGLYRCYLSNIKVDILGGRKPLKKVYSPKYVIQSTIFIKWKKNEVKYLLKEAYTLVTTFSQQLSSFPSSWARHSPLF